MDRRRLRQSPVVEPYHPDRDGCDCEKLGRELNADCLHDDPCWTSREAWASTQGTAEQSPPSTDSEESRVEGLVVRVAELEKERERTLGKAHEVITALGESQARVDVLEAALEAANKVVAAAKDVAREREGHELGGESPLYVKLCSLDEALAGVPKQDSQAENLGGE